MANEFAAYTSNVLRDPWFNIIDGSTATAALTDFGLVAEATVDTEITNGTTIPMGGADGLLLMVAGTDADGEAGVLSVSRCTKVPDEAFYMQEPGLNATVTLCSATAGLAALGLATGEFWADGIVATTGYPATGTLFTTGVVIGNSNTSNIPAWVIVYANGAPYLRVQTDVTTATSLSVIGRRVVGLSQRD